jgi:hypothetical protein
MSLDTYHAHARLLQRLLTSMDATFEEALRHPKLIQKDQEVLAEMRLWTAQGLFLCKQVQSLRGSGSDAETDPLIAAMYTLDEQVTLISKRLRDRDLFRPGAPERVRKMLDASTSPT